MSVEGLRRELRRRFEEDRRRRDELRREIQLLKDNRHKLARHLQEVREGAPFSRIQEIGREIGMSIEEPHLGRVMLLRRLREELERMNGRLQDAERELRGVEERLEEGIQCPMCHGIGHITRPHIVREGDIIQEVHETRRCPLCKGSGRIRMEDVLS